MKQILRTTSDDFSPILTFEGNSLTTAERRTIDLSSKIAGWGSDLDSSVRPGVPRDKAPGIGIETLYPSFEQQIPRKKVHKSVEHGKLTPVFGNVCPPRGVSGIIRDVAYKFSEGQLSHWLLLIAADRVDMVEEFFIDLAHLRVPNIPKEMGLKSELKYNRKAVTQKAAFVGLGVLAFVLLAKKRGE